MDVTLRVDPDGSGLKRLSARTILSQSVVHQD